MIPKGSNAGRFRPDLAFIMPCTNDFIKGNKALLVLPQIPHHN